MSRPFSCSGERTERGRDGWQRRNLHLAGEVIPVVDSICAAMIVAGYSEHDLFGLRLALEEAIVNAVKHGNKGDFSKSVRIHYKVRPDCVLVRVEDQGEGFDPYAVPDPLAPENLERSSGRGLLLMKAYATWVRYNNRGNSVTLCKRRSGNSW